MTISDKKLADYEKLPPGQLRRYYPEMPNLIADLREAREQLTKAEAALRYIQDTNCVMRSLSQGECAKAIARAYFTEKDATPKGQS